MLARRASNQEGCAVRLGNKLYELFSDYGWSFLRPFLAWAFFVFISFLIYLIYWWGALSTARTCCNSCSAAGGAFYLAVRHGLVFLGSSTESRMNDAYLCLFGPQTTRSCAVPDPLIQPSSICADNAPHVPVGIPTVEIFHTSLSVILIFLIVLGLRNQFKIK